MNSAGPMSVAERARALPLTFKVVAAIVAILTCTLALFGTATVAVMSRDLSVRLDNALAEAVERSLTYAGPTDHDDYPERNPLDAPGQPSGLLSLVISDGQVVRASYRAPDGAETKLPAADITALTDADLLADPEPAVRVAPNSAVVSRGHAARTVRLSIGEYRVEAVTVLKLDLDSVRIVATGLPTSSVTGPVRSLAATEAVGALAALLFAGVVTFLVVRRSLDPLERISAVATEVAGLPLRSEQVDLADTRVPDDLSQPGTEVGNVGHALNLMLENVDDALRARQRSEDQLRAFVADASHELRTPLAAIRGYADMIRLTEPLSDQGRTSLGRVESQADRMTSLVEDLLMLARLDEGRTPKFIDLDLGELAVEAVMDATAAGPDHEFACRVPDEPMTVHADRRQLAQVVANLLSNARRHTPAGTHVEVSVDGDVPGWVRLIVHDDGPGIEPSFLPHLFDRFARADTQRTAGEGSTGLGLAIVQAVVRAHAGTVTGTSQPGDTTFTVMLPRR